MKSSTERGGPGNSATNSKSFSVSKSSIIRDGWGSRANFQASYGLKMTPDDLEEGEAILNALLERDRLTK
ncbi:hypothetical protein V1525DRAFT_410064 [Lipomyces kononenkoae]|uniref:Uncharacterized protein n=1 Tax=Lipomyces kononenkoae TaxID=34357 RepID=A0ACC3SUU9_LIPKO